MSTPLITSPLITTPLPPTIPCSSSSVASTQANLPSDPGSVDQQADILKQALDLALGSSTDQQLNQQGSLSSINAGLPALPTKLLHRIWANDYVDFAELPPARNKQRALPHYLEGRVLLVHMHELDSTKKAIPDFTTWAQCFAVYSAAILQKQPGRAADLMAYFFATASNARRYKWPSWVVYDQNFRQLMAESQDLVWAKTNASLFTTCFIYAQRTQDDWCRVCYSVEHSPTECPYATPQSSRSLQEVEPKKGAICRDFNNLKGKGCKWGSNCYRRHICSDCRGAHPKFKCPSRKSESPTVPGISLNRTTDRRDAQ